MATVYSRNGVKRDRVAAETGKQFWWFKSDRVLLQLTIANVMENAITIDWAHYMGLVNMSSPEHNGTVIWNSAEWDAAHLKEFIEPVRKENLGNDEELCNGCNGMYFEVERDLEICGCLWCDRDKPGIRRKQVLAPQPTQRSPLHPVINNV